jgi:DNA-binding transcriptional regulator LsrR (DeoR family)
MYLEGTSQRAIARELNIDRRKVRRAIGEAA